MIRVAIVDDHPAVRIGLESAVRSEPGLIPVGAAQAPEEVAPLLDRTQPDVVVLDYHLPRRDGLSMCCELKSEAGAPAVLLYSAYADASLVVPAVIAGADAILPKSTPSAGLFETIRVVAKGDSVLPVISPDLLEIAGGMLDPRDLPILGMLINRISRVEIAGALGVSSDELTDRIGAMLHRLRAPIHVPHEPGAHKH